MHGRAITAQLIMDHTCFTLVNEVVIAPYKYSGLASVGICRYMQPAFVVPYAAMNSVLHHLLRTIAPGADESFSIPLSFCLSIFKDKPLTLPLNSERPSNVLLPPIRHTEIG